MDRTLREMSITEFILEIGKYYKDAEPIDIQYLRSWLEEKKMTGFELFRFYWYVIDSHKYKAFPIQGKIVEYYMKFAPPTMSGGLSDITQHNRAIMAMWVAYPNKKIVDILITIKNKPSSEYGSTEISFLAKYGDIYTEMSVLKEMGKSKEYIAEKLNEIRQCIENRKEYDLTRRNVILPKIIQE